MERDSFIFYRSFAAIGDIPDISTRDRLIWALIHYAIDGVEPQLDGIEAVLFIAYRPQIDANNKRYENGCKGAEYGKKGAEYGRLGGRPRKRTASRSDEEVTQENPAETYKTPHKPPINPPNVNVNVNDNVHTVVCNSAQARGREAFCKAYAVTDDDTTTTDIDFDGLSKAYSESKKWLQKKAHARRMSWIVKHCSEIIAGKYADFDELTPAQPAVRDDVQIARDAAADKAAELKQRLLDSDSAFYENEKALRMAQMNIAKGESIPLNDLLKERKAILAKHSLTGEAVGDDTKLYTEVL